MRALRVHGPGLRGSHRRTAGGVRMARLTPERLPVRFRTRRGETITALEGGTRPKHPLPWLTGQQNVEFGPRLRREPAAERERLARHYLAQVGLRGFERVYPRSHPGHDAAGGDRGGAGQRPGRPAHRRALRGPGRPDADELLLRVWEEAVPFVTHDIEEALLRGDRAPVMTARPGRVHEEVPAPLPRPRAAEMLTSDAFVRVNRHVMELIREEALRAPETAPAPGEPAPASGPRARG